MNRRAEVAMEKRGDVSMFMVHLTRDDRNVRTEEQGGRNALDNFINILETRTICALGIHCYHGEYLRKLSAEDQKQFQVSCFTETPLDQIAKLLNVGSRKINLEAFGFVFKREFLYSKGAQSAIYINDYGPNQLRDAVNCIYEIGEKNGFAGRSWPLLPFVNVMHNGHDFMWEREYRVLGDVVFELEDLVCVVLPEDEYKLRERLGRMGIAAIDPAWGFEKAIMELASQQCKTRKVWKKLSTDAMKSESSTK
ncbi:hypothetical protein [Zavarzinella formosa]|uniref:hypothetical protein n=1 Tax=Zavarzinella formosa TaxID=360055 RepID=UPI0003797A97|nr:hypothetical protein [Zavarzinella formosa]